MSPIRPWSSASLSLLPFALLLAPSSAEEAASGVPPVERFHALVERPLFRPDRKPPTPPAALPDGGKPDATSASHLGEGPLLRLVGTLIEREGAVALVQREGEPQLVRLVVGDRLGAWQVIAIAADRLVLSDGQQEREWRLLQ